MAVDNRSTSAAARRRGFVQGFIYGVLVACTVFQFAQQWRSLASRATMIYPAAQSISVAATSKRVGVKSDTTIIVTSSLIPSHPSLVVIKNTIESVYTYVRGLDCDTTKLIIVVDGTKKQNDDDDKRYSQMVDNLRGNFSNATILPRGEWIGLSRLVQRALQEVDTKYIYLLQHDLMFSQDIDHNAIVKTMEEFPDELRIVRFNLRMNERMGSDNLTSCFDRPSAVNNVNGIHFTRGGAWSDK